LSIIPLTSILHAVHLIPVYGTASIPHGLSNSQTLDMYRAFYVDKFADHHAFEI
ncbi:uncharacterized protein LAESUDRAFT_618937, partial [Laetiporus sulphureus 93-53]